MLVRGVMSREHHHAHKVLQMLMPPEITLGISFVEAVNEREALAAFKEVEDKRVQDVMTKEIHSVGPDEKVERAIERMVQDRIHRIPVVEKGKLVGILTHGDVLRGFFRPAMRPYGPRSPLIVSHQPAPRHRNGLPQSRHRPQPLS